MPVVSMEERGSGVNTIYCSLIENIFFNSARDPEVLSLMATIVNRVKGDMTDYVPRVFDSVFEVGHLLLLYIFYFRFCLEEKQ